MAEALIQGTLPRPSELEVYLGDGGIYFRQINKEVETPVGVGASEDQPAATPAVGTPLYLFS